MKLSILIPTTPDREKEFSRLMKELQRQIKSGRLSKVAEIISMCDNKEMTIGEKRNRLYLQAKGEYSVQWDSDDWIHAEGISLIIEAMKDKPDCITYKELIIWDGKRVQSSNFSLTYNDWKDNEDGFNYVRTPFFKTPIKTDICKSVTIPDIRFGEDHAFSRLVNPKLKTETYIDEFIYWYTPHQSPHNERYGIK
jgi:glycosyltransferase involved in cell wall biosynthesis